MNAQTLEQAISQLTYITSQIDQFFAAAGHPCTNQEDRTRLLKGDRAWMTDAQREELAWLEEAHIIATAGLKTLLDANRDNREDLDDAAWIISMLVERANTQVKALADTLAGLIELNRQIAVGTGGLAGEDSLELLLELVQRWTFMQTDGDFAIARQQDGTP